MKTIKDTSHRRAKAAKGKERGDREITMQDIARLAGVSAATVSRVLNGSGYVGEDTRRKVRDVIEATGYVPNAAARTLVTQRTKLIGLVFPTLENPVYTEILKGVNDAAMDAGYSVVLGIVGEDEGASHAALLRFAALQVEGIIASNPEYHRRKNVEHLTPFMQTKAPLVHLGEPDGEHSIDGIEVNDYEGGYEVGRHLARLGHERVVIIGQDENIYVARRHEGFRTACRDAGLNLANLRVEKADFTRAGGYEAASRIVKELPETTAVFAMNDIMAMGALEAFEHAGKAVPGDIAVVGFDGIQLGLLIRPRLTTFVIPSWEIGHALGELLIDRIEGRYSGPAKGVTVAGRLAIRESTLGTRKDRT